MYGFHGDFGQEWQVVKIQNSKSHLADKRFIGNGSGIVVGTGKDTEFGVIFSMMQDVEEKRTPLQLDMDNLAKQLSIVSFIVIGFIVLIGVIQKRDWLEMFTIGGESPLYTHTRVEN